MRSMFDGEGVMESNFNHAFEIPKWTYSQGTWVYDL